MGEHSLEELGLSNKRIEHIIKTRKELIEQKDCLFYPLEKECKVKFVCNQCGNCCKNQIIFLLPYEIYSIADFLNLPILTFLLKHCNIALTGPKRKEKIVYLDAKPSCPFLKDDGLCSVYDVRPHSCRLYPVLPNTFSIVSLSQCSGFGGGEYLDIEEMRKSTIMDLNNIDGYLKNARLSHKKLKKLLMKRKL